MVLDQYKQILGEHDGRAQKHIGRKYSGLPRKRNAAAERRFLCFEDNTKASLENPRQLAALPAIGYIPPPCVLQCSVGF